MSDAKKIFEKNMRAISESMAIYKYLSQNACNVDASFILRAQYVLIISAFDTYMHMIIINIIMERFIKCNGKLTYDIPLDVARRLNDLRGEEQRIYLNAFLSKMLSKDSFQSPKSINYACRIIDIKRIWNKLSDSMRMEPKDVQDTLAIIINRRNKIAHESDWNKETLAYEKIEIDDVNDCKSFISKLVEGFEEIVLRENEIENYNDRRIALDVIVETIKERHFVMYGNGYIARRLINQLKRMKCESNLDTIAVTRIPENIIGVNGKPLRLITDVDKNSIILVAVHDEIAKEMLEMLDRMKFSNVIPIYPYLFELELGKPIKKDILVEIDKIISCLHHGYMPSIYYLTLKDYCGEKKYNGRLYKKMCEFFTTTGTAEKRWNRYKHAIEVCRQKGFIQDYNIKICKDYSLIDGLHRLILAKFFGEEFLLADMYENEGYFYSDENIGMGVCLQKEDLAKYYSTHEIEDIEKAYKELGLRS